MVHMLKDIFVVLHQVGGYILERLLLCEYIVANFVLEHLLEDFYGSHHLEEVCIFVEFFLENLEQNLLDFLRLSGLSL